MKNKWAHFITLGKSGVEREWEKRPVWTGADWASSGGQSDVVGDVPVPPDFNFAKEGIVAVGERIPWRVGLDPTPEEDVDPDLAMAREHAGVETAKQTMPVRRYQDKTPTVDMVNEPPHYQLMPGVEVYDVRGAILRKIDFHTVDFETVDDWSRSWEYLTRMWEKNGLEDAKKARWYLDQMINKMEGRTMSDREHADREHQERPPQPERRGPAEHEEREHRERPDQPERRGPAPHAPRD